MVACCRSSGKKASPGRLNRKMPLAARRTYWYDSLMPGRRENLPSDPEQLVELVLALEAENERLRAMLKTINDLHFGAKSERLVVLVDEQMILGLDDVATDATPLPPPANDDAAAKPKTPARPSTKPARRNIGALPKHLPRCEGSVPGVALQPVVAAADIA